MILGEVKLKLEILKFNKTEIWHDDVIINV